MFRRKADRIIDQAHHAIACAEMSLAHSFTDEDRTKAHDELFQAQMFLRRAVQARQDWDSREHDEYEEYPDVPRTAQFDFLQE